MTFTAGSGKGEEAVALPTYAGKEFASGRVKVTKTEELPCSLNHCDWLMGTRVLSMASSQDLSWKAESRVGFLFLPFLCHQQNVPSCGQYIYFPETLLSENI